MDWKASTLLLPINRAEVMSSASGQVGHERESKEAGGPGSSATSAEGWRPLVHWDVPSEPSMWPGMGWAAAGTDPSPALQ